MRRLIGAGGSSSSEETDFRFGPGLIQEAAFTKCCFPDAAVTGGVEKPEYF